MAWINQKTGHWKGYHTGAILKLFIRGMPDHICKACAVQCPLAQYCILQLFWHSTGMLEKG